MSYQILLDYLISNTERHFNNFGIIRDTTTLEFISMSPIYDCGNSMFWDDVSFKCNREYLDRIKTHAFPEKEINLLKYVTDFNLIDLDKLPADNEIWEIYKKDPSLDEDYIVKLINVFQYKKKKLEHYSICKSHKMNSF